MATEANEQEWRRPENWRGGWLGYYRAPRDSRIGVPKKRPWMGWTLNFAHRMSFVYLFLLLAPAMCIMGVIVGSALFPADPVP